MAWQVLWHWKAEGGDASKVLVLMMRVGFE